MQRQRQRRSAGPFDQTDNIETVQDEERDDDTALFVAAEGFRGEPLTRIRSRTAETWQKFNILLLPRRSEDAASAPLQPRPPPPPSTSQRQKSSRFKALFAGRPSRTSRDYIQRAEPSRLYEFPLDQPTALHRPGASSRSDSPSRRSAHATSPSMASTSLSTATARTTPVLSSSTSWTPSSPYGSTTSSLASTSSFSLVDSPSAGVTASHVNEPRTRKPRRRPSLGAIRALALSSFGTRAGDESDHEEDAVGLGLGIRELDLPTDEELLSWRMKGKTTSHAETDRDGDGDGDVERLMSEEDIHNDARGSHARRDGAQRRVSEEKVSRVASVDACFDN